MSQPQTQKNNNTRVQFWTVWVLVTVLAFGGAGFWTWKYWTLAGENERFETSITNTSERLKTLQVGSDELNRERTEIAKRADQQRIMWSDIMTQVLKLETKSARFSTLQINGREVSATIQAGNWETLSEFVDALKKNSATSAVRVLQTNVLEAPVAGATQEAKLTFLFTSFGK